MIGKSMLRIIKIRKATMSTKFRTYIRCENLITHVDLDLSIKYPNHPMEVPFYFEENGKITTKYEKLNVHDAFETEIQKRMIECDTGIFRGRRVFIKVGNGKQGKEFQLVKLGGRVADIHICRASPELESQKLGMYRNFLIKFDNPHMMRIPMEEVHMKLGNNFDEKGNVIFGPHLCSMRLGSFELEC
jgi:hypothetical protein